MKRFKKHWIKEQPDEDDIFIFPTILTRTTVQNLVPHSATILLFSCFWQPHFFCNICTSNTVCKKYNEKKYIYIDNKKEKIVVLVKFQCSKKKKTLCIVLEISADFYKIQPRPQLLHIILKMLSGGIKYKNSSIFLTMQIKKCNSGSKPFLSTPWLAAVNTLQSWREAARVKLEQDCGYKGNKLWFRHGWSYAMATFGYI